MNVALLVLATIVLSALGSFLTGRYLERDQRWYPTPADEDYMRDRCERLAVLLEVSEIIAKYDSPRFSNLRSYTDATRDEEYEPFMDSPFDLPRAS